MPGANHIEEMYREEVIKSTGCDGYYTAESCHNSVNIFPTKIQMLDMYLFAAESVIFLLLVIVSAIIIIQGIRVTLRRLLQMDFPAIENWAVFAISPSLAPLMFMGLAKAIPSWELDFIPANANPLIFYSFKWYSITVLLLGLLLAIKYRLILWYTITGNLDLARQEVAKIRERVAKQRQEAREREKASKLAKETKYLSSLESELTAWNRTTEAEDIQHQSEEARILSEEELLLAFDETKAKLELDKNS